MMKAQSTNGATTRATTAGKASPPKSKSKGKRRSVKATRSSLRAQAMPSARSAPATRATEFIGPAHVPNWNRLGHVYKFHGDSHTVVRFGGFYAISLQSLCMALNTPFERRIDAIHDSTLWAEVYELDVVPEGADAVAFMALRAVPLWLAELDVARVGTPSRLRLYRETFSTSIWGDLPTIVDRSELSRPVGGDTPPRMFSWEEMAAALGVVPVWKKFDYWLVTGTSELSAATSGDVGHVGSRSPLRDDHMSTPNAVIAHPAAIGNGCAWEES